MLLQSEGIAFGAAGDTFCNLIFSADENTKVLYIGVVCLVNQCLQRPLLLFKFAYVMNLDPQWLCKTKLVPHFHEKVQTIVNCCTGVDCSVSYTARNDVDSFPRDKISLQKRGTPARCREVPVSTQTHQNPDIISQKTRNVTCQLRRWWS